jgi:hypothetical protein
VPFGATLLQHHLARRRFMRFTLALGLALGLAATVPAAAQKLDLRTLKCDEFIKQDKDFHGQILMWLSA